MVVQHNLTAMNTSRMLGVTTGKQAKSSEKLSSGYKINRAADDAAGLSISEKMRKQVRGLQRGVENTLDGISLCQVMDGALSEVTSMVQRISELAIQSANGTNSESDREAIQNEVDEILQEINRVGETTRFNELYPFKLDESKLKELENVHVSTNAGAEGNIDFSSLKLADVSLGMNPFSDGADPNHLALQAIVNDSDSNFDGKIYKMIYGDGSTSSSSFRLTYTDANDQTVTKTVKMSDFKADNAPATDAPTYNYDANAKTWSRTYHYEEDGVDIDIVQTVRVSKDTDTEKDYEITYTFVNNNTVADPTAQNKDVAVEFMFHTDTAYNNNDQCEGYYIDGKRIENYCIYTEPNSNLIGNQTNNYIYEDTKVPENFSIVDVDEALAFSEKISFVGHDSPTSVSIGHYDQIDEWSYYNRLNSQLGTDTERKDLGFSLYYTGEIGNNTANSVTYSFNYGIVATGADENLKGVNINKSGVEVEIDYAKIPDGSLWIQSGADAMDGMLLTMRPMNALLLGLGKTDLSTEDGAMKAIDETKYALKRVSEHRSIIGAQQNRLEHTVANEENIIENTTAAESRIRDTDIADEMVEYSKNNILAQAGQAMLAQANQSTQGVLSLLQ